MKPTAEQLTPPRARNVLVCFCAVLLSIGGARGGVSHAHSSLSVSAPHQFYSCPEGADAKLVCKEGGAPLDKSDILKNIWLFTPHSDQHCGNHHPRQLSKAHFHHNHTLPPGVRLGSSKHDFWITLQNVTFADQGRYCCWVVETGRDHSHTVKQAPHSSFVLTITPRRNGTLQCTVWDPTTSGGSVAVALAIAACILALLSLPLILLLVYKQRQNGSSSRRGQELVRMDSEAQGHENPVFLGGSPQVKTRSVSQIMTRQSSETGRHLLSDPGTPLSPPAHGDVFFPVEDSIPESPDLPLV